MSPSVRNTLAVILITGGMAVSFFYLEKAFRHGDIRRAIQAVQQTRQTPDDSTILERLVSQYGQEAQLIWVAQTEDNFRGLMLVAVKLPDQKLRRWRVDLVRGTVTSLSSP